MDAIPYLSEPWFTFLAQESRRAIGDGPPRPDAAPFTLIERYRDADAPLADADTALPGFRIDFDPCAADPAERARVRPGAFAHESGTCVLDMDIAAARAVVSQVSGPGLDALLGALIAAGRLTITGELGDCPVDVGAFHDAVVAGTDARAPHPAAEA